MISLRKLAVSLLIIALSSPASDVAENLFKQAEKAERAGDRLQAYILYRRAAQADPKNASYAAKRDALKDVAESARGTLGPDPAAPLPPETWDALGPADSDDPDPDASDDSNAQPAEQPAENINAAEIKEAREALPPARLTPSLEKKSFDLKGDVRSVFEKVAAAYGLTPVFDTDYQLPQPITFRMSDATYDEALHGLASVADSFVVPIGPKVILVSRDTQQKRLDREQVMAVSIPVPERISVQEAQEMVQALQQTMEIRRIAMDPTKRLIFVRDRVSRVMAAEHILATLLRARTQFSIEVQFIETSKTSSLGYGMDLPSQISLVNFGNFLHNVPSIPSNFSSFLTFGGGATLFGLGVTNAAAFATVANASSNNLLSTQIVTLDGQAASLHVGQHYPIVSNSYIGNTNTSVNGSSQVFAPPPTITYEDLGLVIKITPSVQADGEVTLDVDAEFKVLGANTAVGIPIISNRKFAGKVRLQNGEWAVLAGLISTSESETFTGYPGISRIPFLGRLLGRTTTEKNSSEVLLVLKPHLMNLPPWEFESKPIWVGTDSRALTIF